MATTPESNGGAPLVEQMAEFVRSGRIGSLLSNAGAISDGKLRLICIGVLSWLQSSHRFPRMTSMKLSEVGSASDALRRLVAQDEAFSSVFAIGDDGRLHALNPSELPTLAKLAQELYQPPRFVTRRD